MNSETSHIVVGKKQILRLAKENKLSHVQIATDADKDYIAAIQAVANLHGVGVEFRGTKHEIAREHGIEVPSGAVGFVKH